MAYSINGKALGTVTKEKQSKDAQLFEQPIPKNDSSGTYVLDLFGCIKKINLTGIITVAPTTFLNEMNAIIDGDQVPVDYVSDIDGTIKVIMNSFEWDVTEGEVNVLRYSLSLTEAANVS